MGLRRVHRHTYILGVPHPPGAPLYVLLGRVFTLFPFGEVAIRVNFMSALTSALAIWCVYLSTVALGRRALGGQPLQPLGDARDIGVLAGGAVAALTLAFSYTQWYNASEAEVYGYSILFTCLGLWLIFYWEGSGAGAANDRWLLALAYLFGLGGGVHLLCLLTIPSLMLLAWFADRQLQRLIVLLVGWGVVSGLGVVALGPGTGSNGVMVLGLAGLLAYLYGRDRRLFVLLLGVLVLFALGYSTYGALYIRSGLNPAIDENDPETWLAFLKFLNREQYGTESMLTTMLTARASRTYQFWDQQMKYFFQQFPFPLLERDVVFRKATINLPDRVSISLIPYGLGLWGLWWHGRRDWRRFGGVLLLFLVMGFGTIALPEHARPTAARAALRVRRDVLGVRAVDWVGLAGRGRGSAATVGKASGSRDSSGRGWIAAAGRGGRAALSRGRPHGRLYCL